jgi:hypothetical protein
MAFGLLGNKGMHASNGNTAASNKLLDDHFSPRLWKEVLGEIQERKAKLSPHLLEAIKYVCSFCPPCIGLLRLDPLVFV